MARGVNLTMPIRALLLPGMDGTGTLLGEFAQALAPEFDAEIVSYPTDVVLDYDALTAWVRERLPRDEPFALIAESFSGPIAIRLAAEQPNGLIGLVLCASFAASPHPRLGVLARFATLLPLQQSPAWLSMPLLMGRWSTREWSARARDAIRSIDPKVLHQRLQAAATVDVSAQIAAITCPLLYLKASHDRLVPATCWDTIRTRSHNAVCIELEGPHFLLQAKPRECAAAIKR